MSTRILRRMLMLMTIIILKFMKRPFSWGEGVHTAVHVVNHELDWQDASIVLVFYWILVANYSLVHQSRVTLLISVSLKWWIVQCGLLTDALPNLDNKTRWCKYIFRLPEKRYDSNILYKNGSFLVNCWKESWAQKQWIFMGIVT